MTQRVTPVVLVMLVAWALLVVLQLLWHQSTTSQAGIGA
jgi:hypothetical protein